MRELKKFAGIVLVTILLAGGVLGGNVLLEDYFWSHRSESIELDLSRYQDEIEEMTVLNEDLNRHFDENCKKYISEPTEKQKKTFDQYKGYVVDYFRDEYGVDLSERMENLKVCIMDFRFINDYSGSNISGVTANIDGEEFVAVSLSYYTGDTQINSSWFAETLVHELVHASGFLDEESEFITEGFTEALTEKVLHHAGKNYDELSSVYISNANIAKQLLEIDDGIVRGYITDENFSVLDYINELAGAEIGEELEGACMMYTNREKTDTMEFYMQYGVGEILKKHTDDARSISEKYPVGVVLFGLRSLFA